MRTRIGLLAGVLFTGLALACFSLLYTSQARTEKPAHEQIPSTITGTTTKPAATTAHSAWRVGAPVTFEKLTIFPVITDEPAATDDFITLDEGLRAGTVTVTEISSSPRTVRPVAPPNPRNQRAQQNQIPNQVAQISDGARVNTLALTNKSGRKLILIAGEMVIGGKQDRIVGHDCIVASSDTPVPLDVFCVEHGRWSGSSLSFGQSSRSESVTVSGEASGYGVMASPKVREKAQAKKQQTEVWDEVSKMVQENRVATATGDLKSVYEDRRVNSSLESYERAFKDNVTGANVVGVVVAVGGKIISADVFASPRLFRAYWPKMLRSYALEAINATASKQTVGARAAEAFLARVEGEKAASGQEGVYRLTEHQSEKGASFELESAAKAAPVLLHFNRVNKQ